MSTKGRPKTMAGRKPVSLTAEQVEAVENFRFAHRFKTESDAIRRLIDIGLGAEPILRDLLRLFESFPGEPDPDQQKWIAILRKLLGLPEAG